MSREIYDKPPAEFSNYQHLHSQHLPDQCGRCEKYLVTFDVPWWRVCHHCQKVYIVNPYRCWHFKEWDQLRCCKICHGHNQTFQHVCRVYTMKDGRLVDVCCAVANWLKGRGFVNPDDPGIGDDHLHHTYHLDSE